MKPPISTRVFLPVVAAGLALLVGAGCSPQARKARYLEQAERDFKAGQYDQAEIGYLNVLHLDPQAGPAISRLGEIYFDQGRAGQVYPYLLRGRELQPDNLELRLKFGLFFLSAGKPPSARDEATFILDRQPQDPEAMLLLAEAATTPADIAAARVRLQTAASPSAETAPLLVALGTLAVREHKSPEAEADFNRAVALDPKSCAAWSALGALKWAQGDLASAEKALGSAADLAPARSSKRVQYAQFKIQNGQVEAGRRLLLEMTTKTPDFLPAWLWLAELAAQEKKYPESAAFDSRVLARDPVNLAALLLDGRLKLETGESAKAVARLEEVQKLYPQSAPVRYQLARCYLGAGDTAKAAGSLNQAINLAPDFTEAIVLLAGINLRRGDPKTAIIALKQLVQQHPDALPQAWILLAEAYRSIGDFDQAIAVYHRVDEARPGNPQTAWLIGLIQVQQGRKDEARQAFEKALELSPDYLPALEQLVDLDTAAKQYPAALQRIDSRVEKNPTVAGLYLLRAKVHVAQQDPNQAEVALRKALELQPDSTTAYLMLARLYEATHQQDKALANLQAVLAKNPKNVEAWMLTAVIQDQRKDYPAARDSYEKILAINPRFTPALNNLAYLYSEQFKQLDKAFEMAQRARELLPNEPHLADTLGWILFQKRQYPWALTLLQESAGKLPESAEIQYHLGMAHSMMGEEGPARAALQRAVQLNQDFPGKGNAGQRLALLAIDPATAGADARATLEREVAEHPDDPIALARLAVVHERAGLIENAVGDWQAALKANPRNLAALMGLARLYAARGDTDKAFEQAKLAHQQDPDEPDAAHLLGRLAYTLGNHPWALTLLQDSARKKPDDPEVLFDLAQAQFSVGQVPEAGATMRLALDKGPAFARAGEARRFVDLTGLAGNPAGAVAASDRVQQILRSAPNDGPALLAQAVIDEQRLDSRAAEGAYEKLRVTFPGFAPATRRLAILYAASPDDNPKAYDLATKAREAYPTDPEVAKALGIATYRQGNFNRAVTLLREAADRRATDAELWYYLGRAHAGLKQSAESRPALQKALDLNLRPDLAAEARRVLAEPN